MQPRTEPPPARGDETDLYQRHHCALQRAVSRAVHAPPELVEDACQVAWTNLLRYQPERYAIFHWLRTVAIHEAYRLSRIERRAIYLELLAVEHHNWADTLADPRSLDVTIDAREALRTLSRLPDKQRTDLALKVAGFSYDEIAELTGGRTFTNVSKTLTRARALVRVQRAEPAERRTAPRGRTASAKR